MSIEKINKNQISDEKLGKISGGQNGDSKKEGAYFSDEVKYLYNIGDEVEVYDNDWHTTTEHGKIIDRRAKYVYPRSYSDGYGGAHYIGEYQIHYRDKVAGYHTQDDWVTADDIER